MRMSSSVAPTTENQNRYIPCILANGRLTTALLAFLLIIILSIFVKIDSYAFSLDIQSQVELFDYDVYLTYKGGSVDGYFNPYPIIVENLSGWGSYTSDASNLNYWNTMYLQTNNLRRYVYGIPNNNIYRWNDQNFGGSQIQQIKLRYVNFSADMTTYSTGSFSLGGVTGNSYVKINNLAISPKPTTRESLGTARWPILYGSASSSTGTPYPASLGGFLVSNINLNIPIFNNDDDAAEFFRSGDMSLVQNTEENGWGRGDPLGVIKPKYSANGSDTTASTFREYIEWSPTSTSGFDVTGAGVGVQFAIKDRSYYHNHRLGQPSNYYDFVYSRVAWLTSKIYPYGSSKRAWLEGSATNSGLYGHMKIVGEARGSDLQYGFSAWSLYANQNTDSKLSTFANNLLNNNTNTIMDVVMATSDANASVCLSYDIYARIHDGGGQRYGNWLKINKNSTPIDQQSDRSNGGITKEPVVIPNFPSTPSSTDWFATDDDDPSTDDDDKDNEPLPVGINDPTDGSPTYIYNNYTYNYDNRTWIENYYTNDDTKNVGDALDYIKNMPKMFGIFRLLFGGLVPDWAITFFDVAIPVIIACMIFKAAKTIIPFI